MLRSFALFAAFRATLRWPALAHWMLCNHGCTWFRKSFWVKKSTETETSGAISRGWHKKGPAWPKLCQWVRYTLLERMFRHLRMLSSSKVLILHPWMYLKRSISCFHYKWVTTEPEWLTRARWVILCKALFEMTTAGYRKYARVDRAVWLVAPAVVRHWSFYFRSFFHRWLRISLCFTVFLIKS